LRSVLPSFGCEMGKCQQLLVAWERPARSIFGSFPLYAHNAQLVLVSIPRKNAFETSGATVYEETPIIWFTTNTEFLEQVLNVITEA